MPLPGTILCRHRRDSEWTVISPLYGQHPPNGSVSIAVVNLRICHSEGIRSTEHSATLDTFSRTFEQFRATIPYIGEGPLVRVQANRACP
jgi:hypothetical protein